MPTLPGFFVRTAILILPCVACGRGPDTTSPRWIHLARAFEARPVEEAIRGWEAFGQGIRVRANGEGAWIETDLPRSDWSLEDAPTNRWGTERPASDALPHRIGERVELVAGGRAYGRMDYADRNDRSIEIGAGRYYVTEGRILLRLPAGAEPEEATVFGSFLDRGRERDGTWRALVGNIVADGLSVWPGERAELSVDLPPASILRFQTAVHPIAGTGEVTFQIRLDGEPLFSFQQAGAAGGDVHHAVSLPVAGRTDARLVFAVEGDPAMSAFLTPVIGPAQIGTYGARPWGATRPDIVLFLADTFRADLMSAWGGAPDVMTALNRLAERSVVFREARSTSIWTLPSHASMFTGVQPTQHGAVLQQSALPQRLATIAEELAANGYRTGAVTDSGFVSRYFAMDQGFQSFDETAYAERDLRRTLADAREFLARDDGRPVFLFVHTYRTHQPYRLGPDEDTTAFFDLRRRIRARLKAWDRQGDVEPLLREFLAEFHGLYIGGARGLDQQFGPWFDALEQLGLFEQGYFVFTSDHGDEFLEHGRRYHHGAPHEEKIRIPLLIHGAGLAPRSVRFGASLIDLPPTLAALAGIPAPVAWIGSPLLELDLERPLLAHNVEDGRSYLAVFQGDRKIHYNGALDALEAAFDLSVDPREQTDVLGTADWPEELARSFAPLWEELSRPLGDPETAELTEDLRQRLRELGYVE